MTGAELRRIRTRLGLTQAALAERLGVTGNTVARWERDEVRITEPAGRLIAFVAGSAPERRRKRRLTR
jgi:DNA-binding transcriptional regulator YiaG